MRKCTPNKDSCRNLSMYAPVVTRKEEVDREGSFKLKGYCTIVEVSLEVVCRELEDGRVYLEAQNVCWSSTLHLDRRKIRVGRGRNCRGIKRITRKEDPVEVQRVEGQ